MDLLFLSIFIGVGIFYLLLGLFVSKGIKNREDYFLAGRNLGLFSLTFTLIATQIGGGMLLGTAAESYKVGYYGIFYTLGICLGFLILGLGLASKLRALNISTTAELFKIRYNSLSLQKVASLLSIITLFGILGAQVVALKSLLFALGFNNEIVFLLFWLFIITYTVVGGLKAVAVTDAFQIIFLLSIFCILFVISLFSEPTSFFSFKSFLVRQNFFSSKSFSFFTLFPVVFNPMMFSIIEQDLAQRFFSAKNKKIATLSALLAGSCMLLFSFVPVYFGMKAKLSGIILSAGANPLIVILNSFSTKFFLSLLVCGLSAAITSTADSLLCAISSNICQDFDFTWLGIKNRLKFSQLVTAIVGVLAVFVSYFSNDIIGILVQSYELSISCLFVPISFSFFKKKLNKNAASISMIFWSLSFIIFRIYELPFPKELAALLLSSVGYFIGDFFSEK